MRTAGPQRPDRMPEDLPDRMPDGMPEDMPEHLPEDMPGRMPEDMPATKCINVMVGITRSKIIFYMYQYPLVNVQKTVENPSCFMGKFTISMDLYVFHPLVSCYITIWKDPLFCSWVNPLFRLGHVQ